MGRRATSAAGAVARAAHGQVNVRFPEDVGRWLEARAGGRRRVPAYLRDLVDRERAREQERELRATFDRAAEELTAEDHEERLLFMRALPDIG